MKPIQTALSKVQEAKKLEEYQDAYERFGVNKIILLIDLVIFIGLMMPLIAFIFVYAIVGMPMFLYMSIGWAAFMLLFGGIMFGWRINKSKKVKQVIDEGKICEAKVLDNYENWSITMNQWPQRVIKLRIKGKNVEFRTFNRKVAEKFKKGKTMKVRWMPEQPNVVIPV